MRRKEEAETRTLPSPLIFESSHNCGDEYLSTTKGKIILFCAEFGILVFNCQESEKPPSNSFGFCSSVNDAGACGSGNKS